MARAMANSRQPAEASQTLAPFEAASQSKYSSPPHRDSTRIANRQTDLLSKAIADPDAINGSGQAPDLRDSKGLNTTPIVWMCIIVLAVILLVIFCYLGYKRQNRRDELAGAPRNDEEQRLPQVGIVG
ncbi:hypothetical protein EPUS_08881 [Endocarpon pusillum Z07020]|uniref:Uncharacterized protein n=1 Tax=Endocarpon pusillum (strain Z07020 / HMAS-L-300199) TaxID=1263415 RepID=U1G9J3_ENDPU|nr:uncharacterized protein EPUS_08881 [Endocarpon pusillum Z07020]ERF74142.1 hypothetical protein EPUS_08881 [Endocarpon pusillum Z07020]